MSSSRVAHDPSAREEVVVRNIVFTPDAMLIEGDEGRRAFDLDQIARFSLLAGC